MESSLKLSHLDETKLGSYACYVHASTGTIRHKFELVRAQSSSSDSAELDSDGVRVFVPRPTRKIDLVIEKVKPSSNIFMIRNEIRVGETYEFDCISGRSLISSKLIKNGVVVYLFINKLKRCDVACEMGKANQRFALDPSEQSATTRVSIDDRVVRGARRGRVSMRIEEQRRSGRDKLELGWVGERWRRRHGVGGRRVVVPQFPALSSEPLGERGTRTSLASATQVGSRGTQESISNAHAQNATFQAEKVVD